MISISRKKFLCDFKRKIIGEHQGQKIQFLLRREFQTLNFKCQIFTLKF